MTRPGGRHSSPDEPFLPPTEGLGFAVPRYEPSRYSVPPYVTGGSQPIGRDGGSRRHPGVLDRSAEETGPLPEPDLWAHGSGHLPSARHSSDGRETGWRSGGGDPGSGHPSAPLPPLPPGAWDRLPPRRGPEEDAPTVAQSRLPAAPLDTDRQSRQTPGPVGGSRADDDHEAAARTSDPDDGPDWDDQTGGLEVLGAHVAEDAPRRRSRGRGQRSRHAAPADAQDLDENFLEHDDASGGGMAVEPHDGRTGRARRRRSPFAVLFSLLVLAGLVVGIVLGGQQLYQLVDPTAEDYTGQGTGAVQIRVQDGDTLSDIARTLVDAGVIASVGPFVDAAETNAASMGIQPGVYDLRGQMSGQAALDLLLDPASRMLSRVTLPEGLTVQRTLVRIAEETGRPVEEFQAAAADTVALGLPAYANGQLEGFLFPATYDLEPDQTAVDVLRAMVARSQQAFTELGIPEADRLTVVTKASLVQAEAGSVEDMGKVARVLENRISDGMPLQLDTTVNYANGKGGITTTPEDRANPSPYNTYLHPGLPPGAINNPGEDALRAVLNPTPGEWRFFVVVDPDTGDTRFAVTGAEHQQNVLLFQQWLRENPEG